MKKKTSKAYITEDETTRDSPIVIESALAYEPFSVMANAKRGVTKSRLVKLADYMGVTLADLCSLLNISIRTVQRYSDSEKLDTHLSEHILLLERLYKKGQQGMFTSPAGFNEWMKKPNIAFANMRPIDMADTYTGIETIYNKLHQMEHGIYM